MTLKISICVNKKIGLPDYGSAGSHCDITLEADNSVLDNAEEFQRRVQKAYDLARQSVEAELAHHRGNGTARQDTRPTPPPKTEYRNSAPPERNENRFPISDKQKSFIAQLSKAAKVSSAKLDAYCKTAFGKTCSNLSSQEASRLIDDLKTAKERKGGLA